ncbi:hypothetical protein C8Q79DRAFT_1000598 [Trametes meyenii]|nr:hypothetical protein C8Q79DRAFT_1000598 [Trametes meyenii]
MGLAGRKTKQRIPNDPRNLAWANDANKFGAAYLAKFGWDSSKGLGVSGEGRTTAISVTQKLDMLGIGADHRNSQEGIAWKQNKDFENLLKRLNAANGTAETQEDLPMKVDGFHRAGPGAGAETVQEESGKEEVQDKLTEEDADKKSKKKRKKGADGEEGEDRKKKRKKSKSSDNQSEAESDKKDKKKKKKRDASEELAPTVDQAAEVSVLVAQPTATVRSKAPRLHRARHMASKNLASKSASAIAEILGIAPDPSMSSTPSLSGSATPYSGFSSSTATPYPSTSYEPGPSTSSSSSGSGVATPAQGDELKLQELTVSSKSVMDYFKEKLSAKSNSASSSGASTPKDEVPDDYAERPRMGLGASRLRVEIKAEVEEEEREGRRGLGSIGSGAARGGFAAMFARASTTITSTLEVSTDDAQDEAALASDEPEPAQKSKDRKKDKKDKKGKGKAQVVADGEDVAAVEKSERKRRKEEKRRRKESESQGEAVAEDVDAVKRSQDKERKRKKDKNTKAES